MSEFRQFSKDTHKKMHESYYDRKSVIQSNINKARELKDEEALKHWENRSRQMDLSIRITYNTRWVQEQVKTLQHHYNKVLQSKPNDFYSPVKLLPETLEHKEAQYCLKQLRKIQSCKKCYGRGFTAINESLRELTLCNCVNNNKEILLKDYER